MQSRIFVVVVTAVSLLTAGDALAIGSMQRPPVIDLGVSTPVSDPSALDVFPDDILRGCGSHRRYDPETQTCRGPADF
jgi:hypothetical protein